MTQSHVRTFVLLALAAVLTAVPAAAERIERDYQESFDVEPGARLHLEHGDGDVTITPWDQDVVAIDVRYRADLKGVGASRKGEFKVDFEHEGDTIRVTGREPSFVGVGVFSFRTKEYTYKIQAPSYVDLRLEGEDGDATIGGWRAVIEAATEDGDLHVDDVDAERFDFKLEDGDVTIQGLTGELLIKTSDGDIGIEGCSSQRAEIRTEDGDVLIRQGEGSFEIHAADGDVELRRMQVDAVHVETDDGDVDLDLLGARDLDLTVVTEDGTVDVTAASGLSAELEVTTGDGRIQVDAPGANLSKSRRQVTGRLGAGEGRIRIRTDDGDVTLREHD